MAKNIVKLLAPAVVVTIAFFGFTTWQQNYDPRDATEHRASLEVLDKVVQPPGTTAVYRSIGGVVRAIPVTTQQEPTLYVELDGVILATVVDQDRYHQVEVGATVDVIYLEPKYWGEPFALRVEWGVAD